MLLFATPILAFQAFLFYKVWKRRQWAAYALLIFVAFVLYRELPGYRFVLTHAHRASSTSLLRGPLMAFAPGVLQLAAFGYLFSKSSRLWFREDSTEPTEAARDDRIPAKKCSSNYRSIVVGTLVSACVLGVVILLSYLGAKAIGGDSEELKPGDPNYPTTVATPAHVIPFVATGLQYGNLRFVAGYVSNVKLCGHQIGLGGYFPYGLTIPIQLARTQDDTYHGDIIDKLEPGHCGWKFTGVSYEWPKGGGNAIGIFNDRQDIEVLSTPHIDMWCYKVTEGRFKSPDPQCEILAVLRWPNAVRRLNPDFLATFSHQQQNDDGNVPITINTKELSIELHNLDATPGALLPVGDRAAQIKASQEAKAVAEATPELKALRCEQSANEEYIRSHRPLPNTDTQRAALKAIEDKCRADFNLPPTDPRAAGGPCASERSCGFEHDGSKVRRQQFRGMAAISAVPTYSRDEGGEAAGVDPELSSGAGIDERT